MARWRRFRRGKGEDLVVSLAPQELEVLRGLPDELRNVLEGPADDTARARIFPRAYLDPTAEEAEEQWQELVHPELLRDRLDALALVTATLARAEPVGEWQEVELTSDEVQAWLGVLNDTRLVLGTRLEVQEGEHTMAPSDPRAAAFALYQWLTALENDLVEMLL